MADVQVTDSASNVHQINVDTLADSTDTQVVKMQLGNAGQDDGLVSSDNPVPVSIMGVLLSTIRGVFGRFSFDSTNQLRTTTAVTSLPTLASVTTVSTVSTVTTVGTVNAVTVANTGLGDNGKNSTSQYMTANSFYNSIGFNFARS